MSKIVVHRVLFYSIVQHKVCFLFRIIKWKTLTSRSCFLIKHVPSRNTWEAGEVGFLAWLQDWEWLRGTDWEQIGFSYGIEEQEGARGAAAGWVCVPG